MENKKRAQRIAERLLQWQIVIPADELERIILSELPPKSAQRPRCPKCGKTDENPWCEFSGNTGIGITGIHTGKPVEICCSACGATFECAYLADFAQFFGPAPECICEYPYEVGHYEDCPVHGKKSGPAPEVRELVEAGERMKEAMSCLPIDRSEEWAVSASVAARESVKRWVSALAALKEKGL